MLSLRTKKTLLILHLILVAVWIGGLAAIFFLQYYKNNYFPLSDSSGANKLIFLLFDRIIINISIIVALSGLAFSLFTSWGFFKFRWVIFKWISVLLLAYFLVFWAAPAVNGLAALSDVYGSEAIGRADYLLYDQQVSWFTLITLAVLVLVVSVSVFKPWGTRKQKFKLKRRIVLTSGSIIGLLLCVSIVMQVVQLRHYRMMKVEPADLTRLSDGIYYGKADYGFVYQVAVEIKNQRIRDIKILKNRDSFYAQLAEGITVKIIRTQQPVTDTVTGATTTSKILMKAVESALTNK